MNLASRLKDLLFFTLLVLMQVLVFNHINFFGYANPYIYVLFLLFYPVNRSPYLYIFLAFLLGATIDFFSSLGGVNAFACVLIAYFRYFLVKLLASGSNTERENFRLYNLSILQWILYLFVIIFSHHFIVDFIDNFNLNNTLIVLTRSTIGASLTFLICGLILLLVPFKRADDY